MDSNILCGEKIDALNTSEIRCAICLELGSKYTCPKCNIMYCSLNCYKSEKHANCSEEFYKDRVIEELKIISTEESDRNKVLDILKRVNEENLSEDEIDSDDDSILDLNERLQGIDLDDADTVWKCLTNEEKNEFERLLHSDDITQIIPEFIPWWSKWHEKRVEDYEQFLNKQKEYVAGCPEHIKQTNDLSFAKSKASPLLLWNIVNVLGSYVYVVRYYLGEHFNFQSDSTNMILSLSSGLSKNDNFASKNLAIESISQNIINSTKSSDENIQLMKQDVECLLNGPDDRDKNYYILSALSDIHSLFTKSLKYKGQYGVSKDGEFTKKFPTAIPIIIDRKLIRQCVKKIEYYIAWAK